MPPVGQGFLDVPSFQVEDYWVDYSPNNFQPRVPGRDLNQQWYDSRDHRGAFGRKEKTKRFMLGPVHFEKNRDEDNEWGPIRILGAGTYGRVGQWQKRDARNIPVDELAIKEAVYDEPDQTATSLEVPTTFKKPRLLKEAAIQSDLNWKDDRAAPRLRRYKFISEHQADEKGRYRFYLELCPHGTLDHLRRLYRAWDHHLPEVFVWHVFRHLAISCEALREPPPPDTLAVTGARFDDYAQDEKDGLYCLHMDMKPQNVLLGYEPYMPSDPDLEHDFPEPRLSDFGMSEYTGETDFRNPFDFWWRGTKAYQPTEQQFYGAHWRIPPNGATVRTHDERGRRFDWKHAKYLQRNENYETKTGDVKFDDSLNVYGIGSTMYAVTTLSKDRQLSRIRAKHFNKYRQNANHQIYAVRTKRPCVYSSRLRRLIRQCIDPDPTNRPSQVTLMDQIQRGLRLAERRARRARKEAHLADGGDPDVTPPPLESEKLYFRDHDINDLPLGDAGFKPLVDDFAYLVRDVFVNPDIPRLKLPAEKYGKFPESWSRPSGGWRTLYSEKNRDNIWFKPVN